MFRSYSPLRTTGLYNQATWSLALFSRATSPLFNASNPLDKGCLDYGSRACWIKELNSLIDSIFQSDLRTPETVTLTVLISQWGNLYAVIFSRSDFKQFELKYSLIGNSCALRFLTALTRFSVNIVKIIELKDYSTKCDTVPVLGFGLSFTIWLSRPTPPLRLTLRKPSNHLKQRCRENSIN